MEHTIYLYCAWVGGVLIVLQLVMQLVGIGADDAGFDGHADAAVHVGAEGHGDAIFGILSFKTLSAFAAFFGLVGLALLESGMARGARIATASAAGFASMFAVLYMMRGLTKLNASGSLDVRNALGNSGTVYLKVPARGEGRGKVTVEVQGRSMEFPAVTDGEAIATGARVTVVAVDSDALKVVPV